MDNYQDTIISQYGNSPVILALISNFNSYIDPTADFDSFYDCIWNLDTARGVGLDIWARIVGVSRVISYPAKITYFGFNDQPQDYAPFGQAPFWAGVVPTANISLDDGALRTLILVKAAANIAATNAPSLNALLAALFPGRGRAYVVSYGAMRMGYVFEFYLQDFELSILTQSGAIPRPTGVDVFVLQAPQGSTFGFAEAGAFSCPFGSGTFLLNGATRVAQQVIT